MNNPTDPARAGWEVLAQARRRQQPRVVWRLRSPDTTAEAVGSVACAQRQDVVDLARAQGLAVDQDPDGGLTLGLPAEAPDAALHGLNLRLRQAGLLTGWRDEWVAVWPLDLLAPLCGPDRPPPPSLRMERAAARFWGTRTLGAHGNGFVRGPDGRPAWLWIGQRALDKATDPGRLDNLIGGGVPLGQTPQETLCREGWEEAGLETATMRQAVPVRCFLIERDRPEGLQLECLHAFDLELPAGLQPVNQDGEVAQFHCLPVQAALEAAASGAMTVDAALVTLDFGLRHGLLAAGRAASLQQQFEALGLWAP